MSQTLYSGSLALTKLKSAIITTKKGNRAIVIPIDENFLTEKNGAVYLPFSMIVKTEQDQYGQNGFISQSVSSDTYKELGKEKVKELGLPILGNFKNFGNPNDSANVTVIDTATDPEYDDLPF